MALSALRERVIVLCKSELGLEPNTASSRADAYLEFMKLKAEHPDAALAPSHAVDQVWHIHIFDTRSYAELMDLLEPDGGFIHHNPVHSEQPNYEARYATTVSLLGKRSRDELDEDSWELEQGEYKSFNTIIQRDGTQKAGPSVVCHRKQSVMQLIDCLKLLLSCKRIIVRGLDEQNQPSPASLVADGGSNDVTIIDNLETINFCTQGGGCSYNNNLIGFDELHITAGNTVKAPTDTTLLSILPERFLSAGMLQNIQLIMRLQKAETSDTVDTVNTATTTTAATTAINDQTVKARVRSEGNSDVLKYAATVKQAIDTLKQLQHSRVSSSTVAQNILYIEVCFKDELPAYPVELQYGDQQVCILQVRETDAVLDVLSEAARTTGLNIANDVVVAYNGIKFNQDNWHSKLADNSIWEGATLTATIQTDTTEPGSMDVYYKNLRGVTQKVRCTADW
eukprot:19904-Heterococcus_DN1.PRE.1